MSTRIEELYTQTRNHPVCHHLIPLEAVLSYPVPSRRGDLTYLKFLVYRRGIAPRGAMRPVYRPHARLSVEYPTGQLVEYVDLRFADGAPVSPLAEQVGEFPHLQIANLSFQEMIAERSAFFDAIEGIIPLVGRRDLTEDDRQIVARYRALFDMLVEPGLKPFYRALDTEFFEWLEMMA
ncbi:MAG: hypothetical protein JXA93_12065 [Anaerolineae bacterium]|nr:hypothetical protein [Anaerolineae bacterium]